MASDRQIAANRVNARASTGPKTALGRSRSRRNALKHGLTARTVVDVLEDDEEFRSFSLRISSAYRPKTSIHQELVHRLVAILWRLRRAHAVETGLLSIQTKMQRDIRVPDIQTDMLKLLGLEPASGSADPALLEERQKTEAKARAFLRLINFNGGALDQLSRYEVSLWRQAVQLMLLLNPSANPTVL